MTMANSLSRMSIVLVVALFCEVVWATQELRKGSSGSGDVITNASGTSARRRTRSVKPKRTSNVPSSMTAADYFDQGNELIDKQDYAGAIKALEKAITIDPKFEDGYYALSDAYLKLAKDANDTNNQKSLDADRKGREVATSSGNLIQGGLLNSTAMKLVDPVYPPIAKVARVSGTVTVEVLVNEAGVVMSASAVEGHPLLKIAAVKAAMGSTFKPTTREGKPIKVSGTLEIVFQL